MTRIILGVKVKKKKPLWKKLLIGVSVMAALLVVAGVLYVYFSEAAPVKKLEPNKQLGAVAEPKPINPNSPASVAVQAFTEKVAPGQNAMITVKTNKQAKCRISVVYGEVKATDSGLVDKKADEYGVVDWTWTVSKTAPEGEWPVEVTCVHPVNAKWAVGGKDLIVTKAAAQP